MSKEISSIIEFISSIQADRKEVGPRAPVWFRGESGTEPPLCSKIAPYDATEENHFVQTFRRKAGALANTPQQGETDKWLFLAQHYGIPTRLLDWTEGALFALYFAINQKRPNPRVYMLYPHRLNEVVLGEVRDDLSLPLTWGNKKPGYRNIALAWELRKTQDAYNLPLAIPSVYQDNRMITQRSCFTVHGKKLAPLTDLLIEERRELSPRLLEYRIKFDVVDQLIKDLSILGISAASVFPDLDHLTKDIRFDVDRKRDQGKSDELF